MADSYVAKDANGVNVGFDSRDMGAGLQRPRVEVASALAGAMTDVGNSTAVTKVITDANGTLLGYLRGIVWFLVNRFAELGQAVMAASHPVVIASDQTAIPITGTILIGGPSFSQDITPTSSPDLSASPTDLTPAPSSGERTVVESISVSATVPLVLTITEETTGTVLKVFNLTADSLNGEWNPTNGVKLPNINKKLQGQTDGAGQIDITVISHSAA